MGIEQAPTEQGKESARGLKDSSKAEERHVEAEKGSDLAKGADRFEERARSSDAEARVTSNTTDETMRASSAGTRAGFRFLPRP